MNEANTNKNVSNKGKLYELIMTHVELSCRNFDLYLLPGKNNNLSEPSQLTMREKQGIFSIATYCLDEAKKDFPVYPDINNTPKGGKDWFEALDNFDRNVEKWFKKWFGLEEPL